MWRTSWRSKAVNRGRTDKTITKWKRQKDKQPQKTKDRATRNHIKTGGYNLQKRAFRMNWKKNKVPRMLPRLPYRERMSCSMKIKKNRYIKQHKYWTTKAYLTPPHFCVCPKQGSGFTNVICCGFVFCSVS